MSQKKEFTDVSTTTSTHAVVAGSGTVASESIATGAAVVLTEQEVADDIALRAIYNHLRFLRSLGKTEVRIDEVARALSISISQVERIASRLTSRGVKVKE